MGETQWQHQIMDRSEGERRARLDGYDDVSNVPILLCIQDLIHLILKAG